MNDSAENTIVLKDRQTLTVSGVSEVLSFDCDFVTVKTPLGKLEIEGKDMKIVEMSAETGKFTLTGEVDGMFYAKSTAKKKSLFSKNG